MNTKMLAISAVIAALMLQISPVFAACSNACSSSQYTCTLTTTSMTRGTSGTLTASVTNQQTQAQTSITATLLGNWFTGTTTSQVISSISSGESRSLDFTITPNNAGSQDVCVSMGGTCTADCNSVTVSSAAELSVVSLSASPSSVATGATFTVSATIQNGGTETAGSNTAVTAALSSTSGGCTVSGATKTIGTIAGSSSSSQSWSVGAPSSSATCVLTLSASGTPGGSTSSSTSVTVSSTTTTTASNTSSTGSGGASGSVPTGTKINVTVGKATITIPSIAANKSALVEMTKTEETNIRKISITVKNAVKDIVIIVEKPAAKPAEVTNPSGAVYHYLKVETTNFTDTDVSAATLDFQVEKSWIIANNIDETTVALNRYESGNWNKLSTTRLSDNATHVQYSAQSPGLSVFAITGSQPSAVPGTTTTTVPQAGGATTTTTTVPRQQPPGTTPSGGGLEILGLAGLVVIVIVGVAYYYKRQPASGYKAR